MKITTSFSIPLFFSTAFTLLLTIANAQPPQYRAPLNKMFKDEQSKAFMQKQMEMLQNMNMRRVDVTSLEYDFVVTFLDNSKKAVTSAIFTDSVTRKRFLILVDKKFKKDDTNRYRRIYPTQTLDVSAVLIPKDEDNDVPGSYLPGKPADTCWMFKAITGPLTAYSYAIKDELVPLDPSIIVGIQLNTGPILKFNKENLTTLIGQDPAALELINDGKYIKAIKKFNRNSEKESQK